MAVIGTLGTDIDLLVEYVVRSGLSTVLLKTTLLFERVKHQRTNPREFVGLAAGGLPSYTKSCG